MNCNEINSINGGGILLITHLLIQKINTLGFHRTYYAI